MLLLFHDLSVLREGIEQALEQGNKIFINSKQNPRIFFFR